MQLFSNCTQRRSPGIINMFSNLAAVLVIMFFIACNNAEKTAAVTADTTAVSKDTVAAAQPAAPPANFKHQAANVNGVNIHYVIGGAGEPLVLLHGFGQNWYMWNRLLPVLSKHFTVIAPDLRGVGESEKTAGGYDKKPWLQIYMNW